MTTSNNILEINDQILFGRPNCIAICRVAEVREKAVKVDYALEPIWSNNNVIVFNHTCWIPKSVIVNDKNKGLTVKKWFETKFEGGPHIKKYFMKGDEKIFV